MTDPIVRDNLTAKQSTYAVFLPAISGFYATFIGKQRNEEYVDPNRFPQGLTHMEQLNWLNSSQGLFPYKWSLYSGGHANLDLSKQDWSEDMVRNREPGTFILGDSGGFQIAKGLWEGEWRDPNSVEVQNKLAALAAAGPELVTVLDAKGNPVLDKNGVPKQKTIDHLKNYQKLLDAAQKKRDGVLRWLDNISDYGMILDIPTWVIHDKKASQACGITTLPEAVAATKYNNLYFMAHRRGVKNGGARFLNVLQGDNHTSAEAWYQEMKEFCDPAVYPDTHFDGWSMGGQNMCDVHLVLKRLVALRYDNLLQQGVHDWMHFLGTSKLEWAVLLTVIQRAVRKYVNPQFTISFDCASPFLATANGQVYFENVFEHDSKWSYRMAPSADDKKYATDTRKWSNGVVADRIYPRWEDSPISNMLTMKDICIYKPGVPKAGVTITEENFRDPDLYDVLPDANKNGKWGKTSWDSFSYALLMGHNVWMHLTAVQEANRRFDAGEHPAMMQRDGGDYAKFADIVEAIFAAPDRASSEAIIEHYDDYWMEIVGTRGFKGKKTKNARTQFNALFSLSESEVAQTSDDSVQLDNNKLDQLEQEQQ
jgi:hypothetical protein